MKRPVKIALASAKSELIPEFLEKFDAISSKLDLFVVSEFPPPRGRWIPYRVDRSLRENLRRVRAALQNSTIIHAAIVLQPGAPYYAMRLLGLLLAPTRILIYSHNLDHFALKPADIPQIARHLRWRVREQLAWQMNPGGTLYTYYWRLRHPRQLERPVALAVARLAGALISAVKAILPPRKPVIPQDSLPAGISVVIPSRSGLHLLQELLPSLAREMESIIGEVLVVDNGSNDNTAEFLRREYPHVRVLHEASPLSFARAVNRGIAAARYNRLCLLNNDMKPHPGFFAPLLQAFHLVPELFCATAQIFFPPGQRREETGKAVMPFAKSGDTAFPVSCVEPVEGEDLSYVLYGSGGCSVYDTAKLRALGAVGEIYEPAYVEDLDLGVRAWQAGWATVFVSGARVTHQHRTTTSLYYSAGELDRVLETNYLKFLARAVGSPAVFRRLWNKAAARLNYKAAMEHHKPSADALRNSPSALTCIKRPIAPERDEYIIALGSGDVAVFPGKAARTGPTILVATCYMPFPLSHGGAVRMYNLMRRASRDFTQILISFVDELHTPPSELLEICVEIVQVRRRGSHVHRNTGRPDVVEEFDSPAFHAALRQTTQKWSPSLVQLEFTQMAQYARDCEGAKTVLVEHDVTIDLYRQLLAEEEDWELRRQLERWVSFERAAWRTVDCVVVMSSKDRSTVSGASRCEVIPNGVDLLRFRPSNIEPQPGRILFIGSFAHFPNLLAMDFFLTEVWPLLEEHSPTLHIIAGARHRYHYERGKNRLRFSLDEPRIEVEDFVADVRPAYERASVVIAPLLASAGTNIKIMEAMAMGKPIVSTTAGINGLELTPGSDVLVSNEAEGMASLIGELLQNPERRTAIGAAARRTVEQRYNWDKIAEEQQRMYTMLLKS